MVRQGGVILGDKAWSDRVGLYSATALVPKGHRGGARRKGLHEVAATILRISGRMGLNTEGVQLTSRKRIERLGGSFWAPAD